MSSANVTIYNEGVYIPFPSCALKLSNLELNSIYFTLTTIISFYLLRTRANCSRSVYIIQMHSFLIISFKIAHQFQGNFKICAGTCPAAFCFRVGSLEMLLHHITLVNSRTSLSNYTHKISTT